MQSLNPNTLVQSLEYLYVTLKQSEPGSLWATDKLSFMIDSNLNDARNFLAKLIEDAKTDDKVRELSLKIILRLGICRSNAEDFLVVTSFLSKSKASFDLREEIADLVKSIESETGASDLKNPFKKCKASFANNAVCFFY